MSERGRVLVAALGGAVMGGLVGYLALTEDGRRTWARVEPVMDRLFGELYRLASASSRPPASARSREAHVVDAPRVAKSAGGAV